MNFPLDIIWIGKDKGIVYILENVPPCKADPCPTYTPQGKAHYVLEVNANFSKKHQIEVGEKAEFLVT